MDACHKDMHIMDEMRRRRSGENAFAWLLLLFSIIILILSYQISGFSSISSPGAFPMAAAAVMVISMAFVLMENRKLKKPNAKVFKDELHRSVKRIFPRIIIYYMGIIFVYMLLLQPLHFFPSTFLFLFISMVYLKGTSWVRSLLVTTGALIGIYVIFQFVFKVTLP